jgi:hypothetical protein
MFVAFFLLYWFKACAVLHKKQAIANEIETTSLDFWDILEIKHFIVQKTTILFLNKFSIYFFKIVWRIFMNKMLYYFFSKNLK